MSLSVEEIERVLVLHQQRLLPTQECWCRKRFDETNKMSAHRRHVALMLQQEMEKEGGK